jgi:hypothetical protein
MRCLEIEQYCELPPEEYNQDDISPQTCDYNCIAFALGKTDKPWWPSNRYPDDYEWPTDLPREEYQKEKLKHFITVFERHGYRICDKGNIKLEIGIEKIAIYLGWSGSPTHASRQLESGWWTSKCGDYEDIKHKTPYSVEGKNYGQVIAVMRRRRDGKPFLSERIKQLLNRWLPF